jgi:hypothetical protein
MAVIEIAKIQVRRGQENQTGVPQLAGGEFAWATDNENLYIGLKREDGGARDANIRVLTENDVRLFTSFVSSGMLNTTTNYIWNVDNAETITSSTYINGVATTGNDRVIRSVQNKLDDFVNVADFGVVTSTATEAIDCSIALQTAIDHLFLDMDVYNTATQYDTQRSLRYNKKLYFPAGVYRIGQTLKIPRDTVIIGEGIDKTVIEDVTAGTGIFKTVDWYGRRSEHSQNNYDHGEFDALNTNSSTLSITGPGQPKNIHIEGMTLRYTTSSVVNPNLALISLDCVDNAVIREVKFQGTYTSLLNPAVGPGYTGIDIRGYNACTSENILIDNCQFEGLYYDVKSNYDTNHIVIQNNSFKYSTYGIAFNTATNVVATSGPTYARIVNNKFQNIYNQGIYIGPNQNGAPTNHVSENNSFIRVGDQGVTEGSNSVGTSVIKFETRGNSSVNDYFGREHFHNRNFGSTYTYYPLIDGRTTIDLNSVSTATLAAFTSTTIMRLPITGNAQFLSLKYNCTSYDTTINKMGTLQIYIRPGATPSDVQLFDEYNMSGTDGGLSWGVAVEPTYKYYELIGINPTLISAVQVELQTKLML